MPLGLIRNTRPLERKAPSRADRFGPTTRFSTAEALVCCTNSVSSPRPMEKSRQLMTAAGLLVTVSRLPTASKLALPCTT